MSRSDKCLSEVLTKNSLFTDFFLLSLYLVPLSFFPDLKSEADEASLSIVIPAGIKQIHTHTTKYKTCTSGLLQIHFKKKNNNKIKSHPSQHWRQIAVTIC